MYYVYVIQSEKTKEFYFGFTTDVDERLASHNRGENESTKFGAPWQLIYFEGYRSEADARTRENKLKQYGNSRSHLKNRAKNSLL